MSNLHKIIEKVIYSRFYSFFTKDKILNNAQFRFREGHSTTLALSEFVEGVLSTFDKGEVVCAVLLDLSKVFWLCGQRDPAKKLEWYSIRGNMFLFLKSYLTERINLWVLVGSNQVLKRLM